MYFILPGFFDHLFHVNTDCINILVSGCVCVCLTAHCCLINVIRSGRKSMSNSVRVTRVTKQVRVTLSPLSTHFRSTFCPQLPAGSMRLWTSQAYWYIRWYWASHVGSAFFSGISAPFRISNDILGHGFCQSYYFGKLSVLKSQIKCQKKCV